jgi:hypothetical protein
MNFYQNIAKNLYTDNTVLPDGTVYGTREYIDIMQGTRDARTYYSSLLFHMSSEPLLMFVNLKPELARLVYKYCHSKLIAAPGNPIEQQPEVSEIIEKQLTQDQIALICIYDKKTLKEYLGKNPTKRQMSKYNKLLSRQERTGLEKVSPTGSRKKSFNKLDKIKSVIPLLCSESGKERANDEARGLELSIEKDISEK